MMYQQLSSPNRKGHRFSDDEFGFLTLFFGALTEQGLAMNATSSLVVFTCELTATTFK